MRSNDKGIRSMLGKLTMLPPFRYPDLHLQQGIAATAQVLDLVQEKENNRGKVQVRLWVVVRMKGRTTYRHIKAVLHKQHLPAVGQMINIRYCPVNLSKVIVIYPNLN